MNLLLAMLLFALLWLACSMWLTMSRYVSRLRALAYRVAALSWTHESDPGGALVDLGNLKNEVRRLRRDWELHPRTPFQDMAVLGCQLLDSWIMEKEQHIQEKISTRKRSTNA